MKKIVFFIAVAFLVPLSYAGDVKIVYENDGSIKYIHPDGTEKKISMDGKTPYGMEIEEEKKSIRRKNFTVEIIYSKMLSDDSMDRYVKRFFNEFEVQAHKKIFSIKVPTGKMKLIISYCKYCKTGHCKRVNKKGLKIIAYLNEKKIKELSFPLDDIISKNNFQLSARKAVDHFL